MARKKLTSGTWSKPTLYRGIMYRSTWEVFISKLLLYSSIEFKYEPQRFYLAPGVSYLPDFFLPQYNIFIEVKGWLREKDSIKMKLFKSKVKTKLVYLGKDELEEIFGFPAAQISKLDFKTYIPTSEVLRRFSLALRRN